MFKSIVRILALALMGLVTPGLQAAGTWAKSSCAPADWSPLDGNLLAGQTGTINGTVATGYSTNDPDLLTDSSVPTAGGKDWIVGMQSGTSVSWTFPTPKVLDQVRVSCAYLAGATYSGFTVSKIEVLTFGTADWRDITSGAEQMASTGKTDIHHMTFTDGDGFPLASGVGGLRVTFGAPPVGFANYCVEIEASGSTEKTGPVLNSLNIIPAKTKAKVVGSLADVGSDATACDVYLSLDQAPAVKIAEGVTASFEYQILGLATDTTYSYEITITNNAEAPKTKVELGSFTTLAADGETASWAIGDYRPGEWTASKGNLLLNLPAAGSTSVSAYANKDVSALTDGKAPTASIGSVVVGFYNDGTIHWTFDEPKTIESLRICSLWEGKTYNGISIKSVEVLYSDDDTTWGALPVPAVEWTGGSQDGQYAILSDAEAGVLADGVVGLKLTFGKAKAAVANYYAEIEAIGYASSGEASAPEFETASVEMPTATKAIVSGSLASIGNKALSATLSFAYGTDPDNLGTPELLTDNAIVATPYSVTLTGLTPNTTYWYSFTAQNDVVETPTVYTRSFRMPELTMLNCSIVVPGDTVSILADGTAYTASATIPVPRGETITLQAVPAAGYVFERWTGDVADAQVSANPLTVVMSQACTVTPVVRLASESVVVTWLGGDGAWEDATQWDRGFVPTEADAVVIPSGTCTAAERVSVSSLSLSGGAKLVVAEPNSGRYGNLTVAGNLLLKDSSELHVSAGPLDGDRYTFATGSGSVTVGRRFEISDTAKFVPCCDQYTGGGVVTRAGEFVLGVSASIEAISLGFAWFKDREPSSCALGSPTGQKGKSGWYGASYGGQGDSYGGGTGVRGADGIEPYGFANAPVHPGSHKFNENQKENDPIAGGGNVRIHATRVTLAGKIEVTTKAVVTDGAPSGGGIWITATKRLNVDDTTQLLAKGGDCRAWAHANGGGGRIAFGLRLTDGELASLAATGELLPKSRTTVCGEEEFLQDYPDVTISLEGGKATDKEDEPLEVCRGTFRYLLGRHPGLVVLVR